MIKLVLLFDNNINAYLSVSELLPIDVEVVQYKCLANMDDKEAIELVEKEFTLAIMTGGSSDVSPGLYQQKTHTKTRGDTQDDLHALRLLTLAEEFSLPVFGICRGFQMMWAVSGGLLSQDVKGHVQVEPHAVHLTASAKIHPQLNYDDVFQVNSDHHQACIPSQEVLKDVTPLLLGHAKAVRANLLNWTDALYTPTTIVEAASWQHMPWAGVQFHPEWNSCSTDGKNFSTDLIDLIINDCLVSPEVA